MTGHWNTCHDLVFDKSNGCGDNARSIFLFQHFWVLKMVQVESSLGVCEQKSFPFQLPHLFINLEKVFLARKFLPRTKINFSELVLGLKTYLAFFQTPKRRYGTTVLK